MVVAFMKHDKRLWTKSWLVVRLTVSGQKLWLEAVKLLKSHGDLFECESDCC